MEIQELKNKIDQSLLINNKAEVKTSKFEIAEELNIYYKSQGFDSKIGQEVGGVFIVNVTFKKLKK